MADTLCGTVKALVVVVIAAHDCLYGAGFSVQRNQRALNGRLLHHGIAAAARLCHADERADFDGVVAQRLAVDGAAGKAHVLDGQICFAPALHIHGNAFIVRTQHNGGNHAGNGVGVGKVLFYFVFDILRRHLAQIQLLFCTAVCAAFVQVAQRFAHGLRGNLLIGDFDRGVHMPAFGIDRFTVSVEQVLACHFGHIKRVLVDFGAVAFVNQRRIECSLLFCSRNHAQFNHVVQNVFLTQACAFGVYNRVEGRRCFGQAGQNGCFGQVQVAHVFVEINFGRRRKTVSALSQIDLVKIKLQNLVFC